MVFVHAMRMVFFSYLAIFAILALLPAFLLAQDISFVSYLIDRASNWATVE